MVNIETTTVLISLIATVLGSYAVNPISTLTDSTTLLSGIVLNGCHLDVGSKRVAVHVDTNGKIKAFDTTGAKTIDSTVSPLNVRVTGNLGNGRIILPGSNAINVIEVTSSTTFTNLAAYTYSDGQSDQSFMLLIDGGTSYVYWSTAVSPYNVKKYDYTAKSRGGSYTPPSMQVWAMCLRGNYLYAMGTVSKIIVLDKTSMTQLSISTISKPISTAVEDDTTADHFFYTDYGATNQIVKIQESGITLTIIQATTITGLGYNLVSIPTTNLLLMSNEGGTGLFQMFQKSTLTAINVFINFSPFSSRYLEHSLALSSLNSSDYVITGAYLPSSNYVHMFKMTYDQCLTRSSATVCTSCEAGYYLYSGACITAAAIPAGKGINTATNVVEVCAVSNCAICTNDKSKCTQCQTSYYLTSSANTSCSTNTIVGYGLDASQPLYLVSCTTINCATCYADHSVCQTCQTIYALKQGLVNSNCFDKYATAGFGILIGSSPGVLKACAASQCANCSLDHIQCVLCNPTYRTKYDDLSVCMSESTLVTGYGIDAGSSKYFRACASSCAACRYDHTHCIQCQTGYRMKSTDTPPAVCIGQTTVAGYGWSLANSSLMAPCGIHCNACLNDYQVCSACSAGFYKKPDESDQSRCYDAASYPLYGKSADSTSLLPCSANCLDCAALNTVCTSCALGTHIVESSSTDKSCQTAGVGQRYNSSLLAMESCRVTGCSLYVNVGQTCPTSAKVCDTCDTGNQYYPVSGSSPLNCTSTTSNHPGYGFDSTTLAFVPCFNTSCRI